jgi:SH3 domain-containing YSC84-like protein 1
VGAASPAGSAEEKPQETPMILPKHILTFIVALISLIGISLPTRAAENASEELVEKSRLTLEKMVRSKEVEPLPTLLMRAKAVLIFPMLLKGAFIFGGEGGSGVLVARDRDGKWGYPAFYTVGSFSVGLQIGGQSSEAVLLIMSERGLKAVMEDQVKLGVDASIAVGPVGVGVEGAAGTHLNADFYSYSLTAGLFFGGSFEGSVVARREDMNQQFYGRAVAPKSIVLDQAVTNPKAEPLRDVLARY